MLPIILILISLTKYSLCDDRLWYSYQFDSGYNNRDELVITKVETADSIKFATNVTKWKSLLSRYKNYLIGLTNNEIVSLQIILDEDKSDSFKYNSTHTSFNSTIQDAVLFEYGRNEVIVIVAIENGLNGNYLNWFRFTDSNNLINIWNWKDLRKKITHLNVFKLQDKNYLLVFNERYEDYTTADLYEFRLGENPDFWLVQTIPLTTASNSSVIINYGPQTFLAIPQKTEIKIFEYVNDHFIFHSNFLANQVSFITSFKLSFQTFLAIDGIDAGIYKFTQKGLIKQEIKDANMNGIDYWLAIRVRTYRDEEILIAERSLHHAGHKSYDVQIILYNEGKFVMHDEMECEYFGEIKHGMNCLLEESTILGVKGSGIISVGESLGILVPKINAPSILFMIHTEMKILESPIQKKIKALKNLRFKMEERIEARRKRLEKQNEIEVEQNVDDKMEMANLKQEPLTFLRESEIPNINIEAIKERLEKIQNTIDDFKFKLDNSPARQGRFRNLVVNGLMTVKGTTQAQETIVTTFNGGSTENVFGDIVRSDNIQPIPSHKTFTNLKTTSVQFDKINGIPSNLLAFKNKTVSLDGDIFFKDKVKVTSEVLSSDVNNLHLENEVITIGNDYKGEIKFEELNVKGSLEVEIVNKFPIHQNYPEALVNMEKQSLDMEIFNRVFIPGNITVENVNGENLDVLLKSLCMKNIPNYIPGLTRVNGDVNVTGNIQIKSLNTLVFPDEYILAKSPIFSRITGSKLFTEIITANEITTRSIKHINPDEIVTLSSNQYIPGKFIFKDIEVTEKLNISHISGNVMENILPNMNLLESNTISSNVIFKNLEVDGTVTIGNELNNVKLFNILDDVIYRDQESVKISGIKSFINGLSVHNNLNVVSNRINEIPVESFVNKETTQNILPKTLNGAVTFENLLLSGNYGDINITKLDQETVKLSGEQFISSSIIFEDEIEIEDLEIEEKLNDILQDEYLYLNEEMNLGDVVLENIRTNNLNVGGNIASQNINLDLEKFEKRRLSYKKPQNISGEFYLAESKIQNLQPEFINNYFFKDIFGVEKYSDKLLGMLQEGKLSIRELLVKDWVNITSIDGIPMEEILKSCLSENKELKLKNLQFADNIYFNDIQVENFNNVKFEDLMKNIVYKNETENLVIEGAKMYENGFEVKNFVNTPKLNNIKVENILRQTGGQKLESPLIIQGNVLLRNNITISNMLNEVSLNYLQEAFQPTNENTFMINGDVMFQRVSYIDEFFVEETIDGHNITEFLSNVANINEDLLLKGTSYFYSPVKVESNINVEESINGINLSKIKDNIVVLTEDTEISGPIVFTQRVSVMNDLEIDNALSGRKVLGIDLENWKKNSIYIDKGIIEGTLHFEEATIQNNIKSETLNGINLNSLIPLRSDETIEKNLEIQEMSSFENISVGNLVNGYKLVPEYQNTVMDGSLQIISSKVFFDNLLVHKNINIKEFINNIPISKLVTLNEPQNLTAQYDFKSECEIDNLHIDGLFGDVNITHWSLNGLKKWSPNPQIISQSWTIKKNLTFGNNADGNKVISGVNMDELLTDIDGMKKYKTNVENSLLMQYRNICHNVDGIIEASKRQIYLYKYLDLYQILETPKVTNVHEFVVSSLNNLEKSKGFNYLLISMKNSCLSPLFIWIDNTFQFVANIETGDIAQVITVKGDDQIFLVTRDNMRRTNCRITGSNIWIFATDNLIPLYKLPDLTLLKDSMHPATFYGMDQENILEFRLVLGNEVSYQIVRKWVLHTYNSAFLPRGLQFGLSLRNGFEIIKLHQYDINIHLEHDFVYNNVAIGEYTIHHNNTFPGRYEGEMIVIKVGYPHWKTLVAVTAHEETTVKDRLDIIKIYDPNDGSVYQKIPCYKPSSLLSLEFGENGETLLVFLEDQKHLYVYEYKGMEGFRFRSATSVMANKLVALDMPIAGGKRIRKFIAVVKQNKIEIIQAIMDGDRNAEKKLNCNL